MMAHEKNGNAATTTIARPRPRPRTLFDQTIFRWRQVFLIFESSLAVTGAKH